MKSGPPPSVPTAISSPEPWRVGDRGEVRLWDASTGEARRTLLTLPDYNQFLFRTPTRIAFSPDGRRVAPARLSFGRYLVPPAATIYGILIPDVLHLDVHVWNVDGSEELCHVSLDCGGSRFDALAFGPGGKLLAFIAPPAPDQPTSGNVRVWDVDERKEAYSLSTPGTPANWPSAPMAAALRSRCRGGMDGGHPGQKKPRRDLGHGDAEETADHPEGGNAGGRSHGGPRRVAAAPASAGLDRLAAERARIQPRRDAPGRRVAGAEGRCAWRFTTLQKAATPASWERWQRARTRAWGRRFSARTAGD